MKSTFTRTTASLLLAAAAIGSLALTAQDKAAAKPAADAKPKAAATANAVNIPIPDIKYTKFVLNNGLTLLVHEDHKAPIVAVNTW